MALERIAELVRRAAQDTGVLHALKNDPARLRSAFDLTGAHLDALNSATAFPLPDRAKSPKSAGAALRSGATKVRAVQAGAFSVNLPGSLLPPEGSGQFTGATNGFAPQPGPAPGTPPAPAPGAHPPPPAPAVKPPVPPPQPPTPPPSVPPPDIPAPPPQKPPTAPSIYHPQPGTPYFPQPQAPPTAPPSTVTQPPGTMPQSGCGCECCAIAGMVSVVAITASTAITAITAITATAARRS
jgi:hypothetical protein